MKKIISEVEVVPIRPRDGLVGFASFIFYDCFYCGSIGINTRPSGGYRLTYPTRKNGEFNNHIFYPINKKVAEIIEKIVVTKFEKLTGLIDQNEHYKLNPMSSDEFEDWSTK